MYQTGSFAVGGDHQAIRIYVALESPPRIVLPPSATNLGQSLGYTQLLSSDVVQLSPLLEKI